MHRWVLNENQIGVDKSTQGFNGWFNIKLYWTQVYWEAVAQFLSFKLDHIFRLLKIITLLAAMR